MSKRNSVGYVKPQEPSFLRKLKEQIGYKEGPTVDTKREDLGAVDDEDLRDIEEEQPQVVVLNPGDLTADEAKQEQNRLEKEQEETPADLNAPIVFKAPSKSQKSEISQVEKSLKNSDKTGSKRSLSQNKEGKPFKKIKNKSLLSFDQDEEEENF